MPATKTNNTKTPKASSKAANSHVSKVEAKMVKLLWELEEAKQRDEEEKRLVLSYGITWSFWDGKDAEQKSG